VTMALGHHRSQAELAAALAGSCWPARTSEKRLGTRNVQDILPHCHPLTVQSSRVPQVLLCCVWVFFLEYANRPLHAVETRKFEWRLGDCPVRPTWHQPRLKNITQFSTHYFLT
jgi:hypothetical protein